MIYVIAHKETKFPELDSWYRILCVGDSIMSWAKLNGMLCAYSKEDVTYNDIRFSELRGLKYVWKHLNNDKDDYIGLCHYRRFFKNDSNQILSSKEIISQLEKADGILTTEIFLKSTIKVFECQSSCYSKDFVKLRNVIKNKYPDYLVEFDSVLNAHQMSIANMFVLKKNLAEKYCEWLFSILDDLSQEISVKKYNDSEKRVFGYFGEILLNVWVKHNRLVIKRYPIVNVETVGKKDNKLMLSLKSLIKRIFFFPNGIPFRRR